MKGGLMLALHAGPLCAAVVFFPATRAAMWIPLALFIAVLTLLVHLAPKAGNSPRNSARRGDTAAGGPGTRPWAEAAGGNGACNGWRCAAHCGPP